MWSEAGDEDAARLWECNPLSKANNPASNPYHEWTEFIAKLHALQHPAKETLLAYIRNHA